ncbi:MAG: hypothetical protein E7336_12465 [Clostridiales bacterium]|nr:hypothetical protein [Clostridiales bacterium]
MSISQSGVLSILNHSLRLSFTNGQKHIDFHDTIKNGKNRYHLFHEKTSIAKEGNDLVVRTAAVNEEDFNAPLPGLIVTYRFHFDDVLSAFHVSVSFGSDMLINGCTVKLMDITTEGMKITSYTGYEFDAQGNPYCKTFSMPEENPDTPSYEELQHMTPHSIWEKMKTRPQTFRDALAIKGENDYLAVIGGNPTFNAEAKFISVFPKFTTYDGDLRFYCGKNSPGAWFLLEEPKDFFAQMHDLQEKTPSLPLFVHNSVYEKEIHLAAGALQADILHSPGGLWIKPIEYTASKEEQQPTPLFYLKLWDTKYQRDMNLDSGNFWDRIDVIQRPGYTRFILSDPDNGRVTQISVILEAFTDEKLHRISWKTRVINRSDRWSVTSISYPTCLARGLNTAMYNAQGGVVVNGFALHSTSFHAIYPTGTGAPTAYCCLYNPMPLTQARENLNALYIGVHDPLGSRKFINMVGAPQSNCTLVSVDYPASYQHHAGNTVTLPGEMVWQRYGGDWFDAANLYREFVHTKAQWFTPMRGRQNSPKWIRENPMWAMTFLPNENPDANPHPTTLKAFYPDTSPDDWYKKAIRLKEALGTPMAFHVYNWHWVPFNNDNPHYFPTHHNFKEGMRALKKADVKVVPYMAAYSWDAHDHRGDDYRFESEAVPATAKDLNGNIVQKSYASTEPNGVLVKFARMCPTTTVWKNEIRQVIRKLYTDYGVDGIYLDVLSAAYDQCCDETHLHEPGHGHFWGDAYNELVHSLRIDAPEEFALVSESVAEVYGSSLDGFLSWCWSNPEVVPAFSRIYGGHTAIFGRLISWNTRQDDAYFRFHIASSLVYGQQLGWIHPEIVDDPVQFPFLKKMVQLRWQYHDFFAEAEMLRPAEITGDIPLLDSESTLRCQYLTHEKAVVSGAWEDASGNRRLFIINASDKETDCVISVPQAEYALCKDCLQLAEIDGLILEKIENQNGMLHLHCHIAKEGYGVIAWQK